jgi:transcriptional regulator with XRE-family HTH domain
MTIKEIFGTNLKHYRKLRRLSQEQLSEKADINPKHLSVIETGASFVSAELLEKFTQILGVSAPALFYSTEEKSVDDSFLNSVDKLIEKELSETTKSIKVQIRHLNNG